MTTRPTTVDLMLAPRRPSTPAYRWLSEALRAAILSGQLRPGARLPSTRALSARYELSRGTIIVAFEQLTAEGYLEGAVGSGTYVRRTVPDELLTVPAPATPTKPRRRLSALDGRLTAFPPSPHGPSRAFRANVPALELFPTTLWAQVTARRMRRASATLFRGCDPMGYRPLQEAIADYVGTSRGVKCRADQVLVVSSVQEALDLTARLLLNPGDRVGVEDPGYVGATRLFESVGAKLLPMPVDGEGMTVDEAALRGARLAYVTPAHQFPLGTTMSVARRLALLEWARATSALIFEDDYDSEFRYSGQPIPALQGLDGGVNVLFAGTFSKVLFPSLRLGYLIVPTDLVDRFRALKSMTSRHAPLLEQAVLTDFIGEGHFARHVRRMRQVYAERLGVLMDAAARRLKGVLEVSPIEAGLQTVGWLRPGLDSERVATEASARAVEVTPLRRYLRQPLGREGPRGQTGEQGLQLGFAAVGKAELERGVRELATILSRLTRA